MPLMVAQLAVVQIDSESHWARVSTPLAQERMIVL